MFCPCPSSSAYFPSLTKLSEKFIYIHSSFFHRDILTKYKSREYKHSNLIYLTTGTIKSPEKIQFGRDLLRLLCSILLIKSGPNKLLFWVVPVKFQYLKGWRFLHMIASLGPAPEFEMLHRISQGSSVFIFPACLLLPPVCPVPPILYFPQNFWVHSNPPSRS